MKFDDLGITVKTLIAIAGGTMTLGGTGVLVFSLISWVQSDAEAAIAAQVNLNARELISIQHNTDQANDAQARKNDRIDRIDREIREIDEELRFGNLSPEERAYKENVRKDLVTLRACINRGEC